MKSQEVLESIVKSIVDDTESVSIVKSDDEKGVLFTLRLAKEDMGKVIGKEGSTAKSIRTVIRAIGMSENARVSLKIEEPEA